MKKVGRSTTLCVEKNFRFRQHFPSHGDCGVVYVEKNFRIHQHLGSHEDCEVPVHKYCVILTLYLCYEGMFWNLKLRQAV